MKVSGKLFMYVIIVMVIAPVFSLIFYSNPNSINVIFEKKNIFFESSSNTIYLLLITVISTLVLGLIPSWFVSLYKFRFRNIIDFLMYLPLAIPTYIMAFSYGEILSYTGPFQSFLRNNFDFLAPFFNIDFLTLEVLGIILGLSLFPYVYAASRISFTLVGKSFLNLSKTLGNNWIETFLKVVIPLSAPAIISAIFLVSMEVLNEYGAVKYFGVNTFTTEIFKTWYALSDETTAAGLSIFLLAIVFILFSVEYVYNSKLKFNYKLNTDLNYIDHKQKTSLLPYIFSFFPIFFGFVIPLSFIIYNVIDNFKIIDFNDLSSFTFNSVFLSFISSFFIVIFLLLVLFIDNEYKSKISKTLSAVTSLGYALPGAVLGLSLIIFSRFIGDNLISYSLTGTYFLLFYALFIRFMAVGRSPLKSSIDKIPISLFDTAKNLGLGSFNLLKKIYVPLNKFALFSAFMLCFIDIMKELPITLILRPFNFDTLSTKTYELAVEEMVDISSFYSLVIIIICSLTLYFVKKINTN